MSSEHLRRSALGVGNVASLRHGSVCAHVPLGGAFGVHPRDVVPGGFPRRGDLGLGCGEHLGWDDDGGAASPGVAPGALPR